MDPNPVETILSIDYTNLAIYLAVIFVLLILSAFFSMSEIVFSSVSKAKLMTSIEENKRGSRKALWLAEHFDRVLSVILIGNNIVNIAISTLGLRIFLELLINLKGSPLVDVINTLTITLIVLIFGEILPKSHGKLHPEKIALRWSGVLYVIVLIFTPIAYPFYKMNRIAMKHQEDDSQNVTSDDLANIIDSMEDSGEIEESEADMIHKVLDLSEIDIRDIMTPRVDVIALDVNSSVEAIKNCFFENQFSRIPVYEGTIDHIIGILFEKDFFKAYVANPNKVSIKKLLTKPLFVVGSMHADNLLSLLKKENVHMAIVLDEYAGFDGVVTMEDTLEELVGEIFDEHDQVPFTMEIIEENEYMVSGDLELETLFDNLEIYNPPENIEATTVGGWVQDGLERLALTGDSVSYKVMSHVNFDELSSESGAEYLLLTFEVKEIVSNRITKVLLTVSNVLGKEEEENKGGE